MPHSRPATPIAIVGPCAAGKTSLAQALRRRGRVARQIAQEHSYVPSMWQILTQPNVLIYLDASFEACSARKSLNWTRAEYNEQKRRLQHARDHCDVYIDSTDMTLEDVERETLDLLDRLVPGGEG
jgi:deoxyadenosine/deoxycytidine kinase